MTSARRVSARAVVPARHAISAAKATAIRQPPAIRLPMASAHPCRRRILAYIGAILRRNSHRIRAARANHAAACLADHGLTLLGDTRTRRDLAVPSQQLAESLWHRKPGFFF